MKFVLAQAAPVTEEGARRPMQRAVLTDAARFPFSPADFQRLSAAGVSMVDIAGHDPADVVEGVRDADAVFVYSALLDRDVLSRFGTCRLIIRCGAGYDAIDVAAARELGIELAYVPAYGSWDVAEHTLALMFAVARRLAALDRTVRAGGWPPYAEIGPMHRLRGTTLGLLGLGRIAQRVAGVAAALGMELCAHDPYAPDELFERSRIYRVTLDELAARADVISLHAPLTAATARIVDAAFLDRVRPGAIMINTSRGELVDEEALVRALADGRLAGAGLDVLAREPPPTGHPLLDLANVLITPHSAAFTDEALASVRSQAIDELLRASVGLPVQNPIPAPNTEELAPRAR